MPVRSLTQVEAAERARLLTVDSYQVAVDLTDLPAGTRVVCTSAIAFTCHEPGASTFADCVAEIESATLNGVALPPAIDGRIPLTGLAAGNVLEVVTVRADSTQGDGIHKSVDPADGRVYLWTDFAPDNTRCLWACFDQPDLKAPHTFTVTAPADWIVLSNSGGPQIETVGDARRWTFPPTPPLSTYNVVINAGPYYELRREGAGHDLGLFARQSLKTVLDRDADELFTLTTQGFEFFTEVFGMPFPQRKYDQVFAPDYAGAMENYGCITWMDWFLRRSTPTRAEWDLFSRYLLHELAHQWFGNIVTMRWWDDLWLNEAFAEFASNWAAVNVTSYSDAWVAHLAGEKLKAYLVDQGPTTHPIRQPVRDVAEGAATFDAITYPKGASVLQQLMIYVGEAAFSKGLTKYFAQHAWGNATLEDLIAAIAGETDRDLERWRTAWLDQAGTDRLTLVQGADGFTLVAKGPNGEPRPQVLAVGAYRRGVEAADPQSASAGAAAMLERIALVEVEVTRPRTPLELPAADLYLVNDGDLTFASTRPDAQTRDSFFDNAAGLPTPISRAVAIATAWDMLINAEATAAEAVRCLTGVLAVETSESLIEPHLNRAADAALLWSTETERQELTAMVAATSLHLARNLSTRKVALRGFAKTVADLEGVAWLQAEAGDDLDLQWRALTRKAQLGGDITAELEALLAKDPDPEAWVSGLTVRAAIPAAAEKSAVWQQLVTERAVPLGSVHQVTTAFWSPGQEDLLRPFAAAFLDLVPEFSRWGLMPATTYTRMLFPLFGVDAGLVQRAQSLVGDAEPVVRANLLEKADLVTRMLRARS
ncbi:aminopeptidase N [Streptomyces sp. SID13031]|uniref:aminopeptidase N n=1 Tax=Streptomyces sp. SID13031 TaxID=2706046 RepID=UPI0013C970A1|nr:aminopeptidase N [Streptomyces sp. SID13031]NEA34228.1 aminopeptidase N [Streptomyces sp. SID13031]